MKSADSNRHPFAIPSVVYSLDGDTLIYRKSVSTVPEALAAVPGVAVQKASSGRSAPIIRGSTGFRPLVLLDGIRLNRSVMREGPNPRWNTFEPLIIDRLDLVKGPSSVLYGTDVVGGAVKVTSLGRDPDFPEIEGRRFGSVHWGRRLYHRFSSGEDSHVVQTETPGSLRRQAGSPRRLHLWGLRRHPRRQAHGNAR